MIQFGVITRVPPSNDKGNLALAFPLFIDSGSWDVPVQAFPFQQAMMIRATVFDLGEILVLGEDGREVAGKGRKPSKWDVTCEQFNTIEEAVACAEKAALSANATVNAEADGG